MAPQDLTKPSLQPEEDGKNDQKCEVVNEGGIFLANPPPGEEIVITGMAGRFPASDDIYEYRYNLLNKKDMISSDCRRWKPVYPEIPHRTGKIGCIEKFDAGFFGVHYRQAYAMDPNCRQVLERTYEAVMDAGYNMQQLRGTNTGVFIGTCFSESEKTWLYDKLESPTFGVTGCTRSMQAQWISYFLGLEGPTQTIDTACSSSLYALEHAYRAIRMGRCDSAIVGGTNLCMHPSVSLQFARLGVLSMDGSCKSFDADANGYARAETVAIIFLQKSRDARRIYAQIVHAKTNCDGFKEQGITFPSYQMQKQLMEEIYRECNVDPTTIDFLEAHATGTKAGDPEEIMAMDEVFCTNRKTPLLVGSVKSNIGHTEPSSGLCSLIKILIAMESDCLIPNINYTTPKEGAEALEKGRMIVLTEEIPWPKDGSGLAAVNSFGFGGSNCHVLLKRWLKQKINDGQPTDNLPRLVSVSGRTEESITYILDDISRRSLDVEYIRLLHETFSNNIPEHPFRGFMIMSKVGEISRSFKWFDGVKQPLCLIFGGPNEKWLNISKPLFTIRWFTDSIQKIHNILFSKGINVLEIIRKGFFKNIVDTVIANVAIQIALVDILKILELSPDYVVGYTSGELVAAYADGALTLEQAIIGAYYFGVCLQNNNNNNKNNLTSYQVKLSKTEIQSILPGEFKIVDHGTETIISGPYQEIISFMNNLKNKKIEFKEVQNDYGQARSEFLERLKNVIPKPKRRSSKWLMPIIDNGELTSKPSAHVSAEHLVDNLLCPTLLNQSVTKLPAKSVVLEIGSVSVKLEGYDVINLVSTENDEKNEIHSFLYSLGRLYNLGYNLKLDKLYPNVQWPVSVNTPMLSPLTKWNHTEDWFVALFKVQEKMKSAERYILFSMKDTDWSFMAGHVIDGRNLVPATGYLVMVWETLSMMMGVPMSDLQVVFENVKFLRATNIPKNGAIALIMVVQKGTGRFEVRESGQTVVTGRIYAPKDFSREILDLPLPIEETGLIPFIAKDIYKELKLRGYNYMGHFRGLESCDLSASKGSVKWTNNWIAFIDNMLQLKLLQEDSRNLYVPTGIEKMAIDPKAHVRYAKKFGETPILPVYAHKATGIVKCGGIEVRGLFANSISRRKPRGEPVLETYKFVPFEAELSTESSVRVHAQIFIENNYAIKVRVVEVVDDATEEGTTPLSPFIYQALSDQPLIQPEVVVLSKNPLELTTVTVEDKKLISETHSCSLVVVSNILKHPEIKQEAINALKENGVILSRENLSVDIEVLERNLDGLDILAVHQTDHDKLILLRRPVEFPISTVIDISKNLNFDWLPALKNALNNNENIIILSQNAPLNGILGFINCLRREPGGLNMKCVFILDNAAPKFNINNDFYFKQLKKGLAINIYKNGKWGTYRHLLLDKTVSVQREHIFSNVTVRGDLSSLRWIEGPLTSKSILLPEKELVHIYYACLNFRDIMTASGRISSDVVTRNRLEQYNVQGFEFCGRNSSGRRVMGIVTSGALASMINADSYLTWEIPNELSMAEAATVPVAYCTVLLGLVMIAQIKSGQSILIHAGSGGVGQAAINVALYHKCQIFTTVGTEEKRDFILTTFPEIPENHIGNSRDTSFEQMVFKETRGRGVDVVLNSLSEEKLQASVRCLAPYGKFLEIGKFDMASNNPVGLKLFTQGRKFYGIMLDAYFEAPPSAKKDINDLITDGLAKGMIKPLNRTIFNEYEVEQAFRYMAGGKHIGKVMIKLREEESNKDIFPEVKLFEGMPRFYGNPDNSYVICGGLGGFGLELADWLVVRGARNLVLISRSGPKTGYQLSRIRLWKSYGANVKISSENITTKEGCVAVINESNQMGPVEGIFNLAVVLKDGFMENQDEQNFMASLEPKAVATQHFDLVSRQMCPELLYFVVFSSVSCGRGNIGQANYGMANSVMERICEQRKTDGFPALAIQWGAVGDVGLVAEMQEFQTEIEISGTLQQRITSCLEVMDTFLKQDEAIVSSMVVAEKKRGAGGAGNMVDAVKTIMGLRDLKTISLYSPLSELGMDSMMAIEIKQTLEREYEVFLTAQDIRSLTFARLLQIADDKTTENATQKNKGEEKEKLPQGIHLLLRCMGDEENSTVPIVKMTSLVKEKAMAPKVFLLPGIEGMASILEPLAANLASHVFCLQFTYNDQPETTIEELAKTLLTRVQGNLPRNTPFTLVAYSFGAVVAVELASLLEAEGYMGRVILIDGAPAMFKELTKQQIPEADSEPLLQTIILCCLMQLYMPSETVMEHKNHIYNCKTFEERVNMVLKLAPEGTPHSERYRRQICFVSYLRIKSVLLYQPKFPKLKSMVKVFKPSQPTIEGFDEDYKIQELCENLVEMSTFDGNHLTIIKNPQIGYAINTIIDTSRSSVYFKQSIMKQRVNVEHTKEAHIKQI